MFKVGDRVELKGRDFGSTHYMTVKEILKNDRVLLDCDCGYTGEQRNINVLKLIKEAKVSLKDRIEALTGWDKEADDMLQEIYADLREQHYIIAIGIRNTESYDYHQEVEILLGLDRKPIISFSYKNQYQKLQAFKDALLWLADKAGLLHDADVVDKDAIRKEVAELHTRLHELEGRL